MITQAKNVKKEKKSEPAVNAFKAKIKNQNQVSKFRFIQEKVTKKANPFIMNCEHVKSKKPYYLYLL